MPSASLGRRYVTPVMSLAQPSSRLHIALVDCYQIWTSDTARMAIHSVKVTPLWMQPSLKNIERKHSFPLVMMSQANCFGVTVQALTDACSRHHQPDSASSRAACIAATGMSWLLTADGHSRWDVAMASIQSWQDSALPALREAPLELPQKLTCTLVPLITTCVVNHR